MATYLDGNVRKATANTVTSMKRSAAARQCPECGRKSAIVTDSQDWGYCIALIRHCRWCGYEHVTEVG